MAIKPEAAGGGGPRENASTGKSIPTSIDAILSELGKQTVNPPGEDPYIGLCYKVLGEMAQSDERVGRLLETTLDRRPLLTPAHAVNLFFRAVQYLELYKVKHDEYPHHLGDEGAWKQELDMLFNEYGQDIEELLGEKNTTTTLYQRYAGPQAVLSALYGDKPLTIVDLGCGGNYGLRGLSLGLPFESITDNTNGNYFSMLLEQGINVKRGAGIDREDPHDPEAKQWRIACSFYPGELGRMARVLVFEEEIARAQRIDFVQANITDVQLESRIPGQGPWQGADAVIISTVLYQLDRMACEQVIHNALKLINSSGVVIVQDFARKNPMATSAEDALDFDTDWFANGWGYRTFVLGGVTGGKFKEIFQWSGGRCRQVRPGEDYFAMVDTAASAQATS